MGSGRKICTHGCYSHLSDGYLKIAWKTCKETVSPLLSLSGVTATQIGPKCGIMYHTIFSNTHDSLSPIFENFICQFRHNSSVLQSAHSNTRLRWWENRSRTYRKAKFIMWPTTCLKRLHKIFLGEGFISEKCGISLFGQSLLGRVHGA